MSQLSKVGVGGQGPLVVIGLYCKEKIIFMLTSGEIYHPDEFIVTDLIIPHVTYIIKKSTDERRLYRIYFSKTLSHINISKRLQLYIAVFGHIYHKTYIKHKQ